VESKLRLTALLVGASLLALDRPARAGDGADLGSSPPTDQAPPAEAAPKAEASTSSGSHSADLAIKLPNFQGLSGMQDMVDARVPEGLTIRGGLRMEQQKTDLKGPLLDFSQETFDLQAYAGVAAMKLFEVGARLPFELNHQTEGNRSGGHNRWSSSNVGDLDVSGKIAICFGNLTLAPYALFTLPTGQHRFDDVVGGRVGGAATLTALDSILAVHANVDGAWISGGHWVIDYRVGVSVVPLATKILLVRPYIFLNGKQALETNPGSDLRVAAGVQGLLFDFVTVELGGSYRFLSQATPTEFGTDEGTWAVQLGAGVAF